MDTHIYCTAAHALADNGRARARTLFLVRRRKTRCKKVTIPTSWSESAAAHLCTPVSIHPYEETMWSHSTVRMYTTNICERESVSSDSPGRDP